MHGEKKFKEALEQLFSYTTWRDIKTSLIVFNKENKNFSNVLSVVENYLKTCPLCRTKREKNKNEWDCTFQKYAASDEIISVFIGVYDLYC